VLRLVPLFVATAVSASLAAETVPTRLAIPAPGVAVGVLASGLAIFLLNSVPARWAARGVVVVGAVLIIRYGSLSSSAGASASAAALAWAVATAISLVLSSRLEDGVLPRLGSTANRRRTGPTVRIMVAVAVIIGAISVAFGPTVASSLDRPDRAGLAPAGLTRPDSPLAANTSLDMSTRPRLSSRVVMTVQTDQPSFLRDSTFDQWDGHTWTRSQPGLTSLGAGGRIRPADDDEAARTGTVVHQKIRIETDASDLLPAAASAVSISSRQPLVQWGDGNVLSVIDPLGRGATYTVTSRVAPATPAALAASGQEPIPQSVLERYAAAPVATPRVQALARRITAHAQSDYEKVLAIEGWLGTHTTYSINAPVSPADRDVVDDFLFRSKVGWCEQIASSLVVLSRLAGVPARLATGFVPGSWDPILRQYRVRERDAHAWAEVWFPTLGWVPFDPTANVPLAGNSSGPPGADWWTSWWALAGLAVVVVGGVMVAARGRRGLMARVRASVPRRRRPAGWVARAEGRLERWGAAGGHPRRSDETAAMYATRLARWSGQDQLVPIGVILDEAAFGPRPLGADDRRVMEALADLDQATGTAPDREREPAFS
jgi:transglutaminase-like putative cysteine protease